MADGQQQWLRLAVLLALFASMLAPTGAQTTGQTPSFMNFTFARPAAADPVAAVGALIYRVLPNFVHMFQLELIAPVDGADVMQLASNDSYIVLRGSSAVALASALNWYLNEYCHVTYDWNNYDLSAVKAPLQLPPAAGTTLRRRFVKWSYYLNVCTMGYSLAFSSWDYWVKHIDWMAMNGINMPLAFVGQEAVLVRLFMEDFGLTFAELQQFIAGPAFLPWFRMGNIQGWGGPVTLNWIEARFSLQLQILTRMRDLGMQPVLSAFAGHVPEGFVHRYPDANVTRSPNWGNFPAPYGQVFLLEATDVRFADIGSRYIALQAQLFGTDSLYSCDTFNEMDPRSSAPSYLASSSRAVYNAMIAADPKAVWLMQSWLFRDSSAFWKPPQIQAYLGAVPDDRLWLLDLSANDYPIWSKTNSFYGKPFIWCNLLNYGGQQGLDGNLTAVQQDLAQAISSNSTIIGVGITMEGIWQNYPAFEYTLRFGWFNNTPQDYIIDYADRRYGPDAPKSISALWRGLGETVYAGQGSFGSLITRRPVLFPSLATSQLPSWLARLAGQGTAGDLVRAYHSSLLPVGSLLKKAPESAATLALVDAWRGLLDVRSTLRNVSSYSFDLVDVSRQVLSNNFSVLFGEYQQVFKARPRQVAKARDLAQRMQELIADYDKLMSSDMNFLLGPWIAAARAWGESPSEQAWLEFNARNQITLWGPDGEANDYASKSWGGLVRAYYAPRWDLFLNQSLAALATGKPFNQTAYTADVLRTVEQPWQVSSEPYPVVPEHDSVDVSLALYQKYIGNL